MRILLFIIYSMNVLHASTIIEGDAFLWDDSVKPHNCHNVDSSSRCREDEEFHAIDSFTSKLVVARQNNRFQEINTLFRDFNTSLFSESALSSYISTHTIFCWESEQSLKRNIGGDIFLKGAIDDAHLSLIIYSLRASRETAPSFDYDTVCHIIVRLLKENPILSRREGLYSLAVSSYYGNALASIVLNENLKCIMNQFYEQKQQKGEEFESREYPKTIKAMDKIGLINFNQRKWNLLIDTFNLSFPVENLELYLSGMQSRITLAESGVAHYWVELGKSIISSRVSIKNYSIQQIRDALGFYKKAGDCGDFEGYYEEACLRYRCQQIGKEELHSIDETGISTEEIIKLFTLSSWLGSVISYEKLGTFSLEHQLQVNELWSADALSLYTDIRGFIKDLRKDK